MTIITTGSFVNVASTPFYLPLAQGVSRFDLMNLSQLASYTSARITNATLYDSSKPAVYPVKVIASYVPSATSTTLATVWTSTAHGYHVGDNVRIYGLTAASGSNQFNGLVQTVTAVSADTFTTKLCTNGGMTSTGSVQKVGSAYVQNSSLYFPQNRVIAGISNANPMVVTTLVPQNYAVGDVVTFSMPTAFGVPQLQASTSGKPFLATVTAVNNAVGTQTVTFGGVDSTNFGVFGKFNGVSAGWPETYPLSFPYMVPNNEGNINNIVNVTPQPLPYGNQDVLSFATQNQGSRGILIGAGDGTAAATTGGLIGSTTDTYVASVSIVISNNEGVTSVALFMEES